MALFKAQVRSVQAKTTASQDKEIVLRLVTDDISALEVGAIPSDQLVLVTIEPASQ